VKTFWNSNRRISGGLSDDIVVENAFRGKDKCRLGSLKSEFLGSDNYEEWFLADVTFKRSVLSDEKISQRGGEKLKLAALVSC
jgi:hypothetical protein